MSRKKPQTPRSRVKNALRQVFLRSRERALALRLADYTCQQCGKHSSTAKGREVKVQVHHKDGIANWEKVIDEVFKELLCEPSRFEVLCKECHEKLHKGGDLNDAGKI
jgi:predicted HNH restriction endonuclease